MSVKEGTIVGYRVLEKPQVFDIPQEYAGACTKVEVPAGRYPVVVRYSWGTPYIVCSMPGVIVYDHFYNRIGAHGSMAVDKHTGQEQTYHWQPYEHSIAWTLLRDEDTDFELAEGVEAREIKFTSYGDGRERSTAGLFVNGEQVKAR